MAFSRNDVHPGHNHLQTALNLGKNIILLHQPDPKAPSYINLDTLKESAPDVSSLAWGETSTVCLAAVSVCCTHPRCC